MVEVYKTNIQTEDQGGTLLEILKSTYPELKISLDLSDCDRSLRVEGKVFVPEELLEVLALMGFHCEIMPLLSHTPFATNEFFVCGVGQRVPTN